MSDYVVVLSTCPTEIGSDLARSLIKKRLCACVNIIPKVTSFYYWKNEIVEDFE
ncbi:MAG: divalent cation tolerance protein CutA, partial [Candidatus Thorarchaeota archaeon]